MASFPIVGDAALTPDGSSFALVSGAPRVAQRLRVGLRTISKSYKYDQGVGLPWLELLQKGNRPALEAHVRRFFLGFDEVRSIIRLTFTRNRTTRVLSIIYWLKLVDGTTLEGSAQI